MDQRSGIEMLDMHLKAATYNGNSHPALDWYDGEYREGLEIADGLSELEWFSLRKVFLDRPYLWQEACVYVMGHCEDGGATGMLLDIFKNCPERIACFASVYLYEREFGVIEDSEREIVRTRAEELITDEVWKSFTELYLEALEGIRDRV